MEHTHTIKLNKRWGANTYHEMTPLLFSNAIKREFMRYFQKQPPDVLCKKGVLKNFTGKHLC